jgi:transcription factor IIIB 90 kDa subunit
MTALRLIARMRRDWMSYGRRPNGLCGAALIIAARMHNFYRSQADVVRVVRIGNVALRERLQEIDRTPTALLTTAQINAGGGDDGKVSSLNDADTAVECNPPSFRPRLTATSAAASQPTSGAGTPGTATPISGAEPGAAPVNPDLVVGGINVSMAPQAGGVRTEADAALEKELAAALSNQQLQQLELESREGEAATAAMRSAGSGFSTQAGSGASRAICITGEYLSGDDLASDIGPDTVGGVEIVAGKSPAALAAFAAAAEAAKEAVKNDGELSDLDDDDVADYLNTEEEFKVKEAVWMEMNRDYLEKQARLEKLKRENPEEYKRQRPCRGSKKRRSADGSAIGDMAAPSPAEASNRVVPKASSRKLNYNVLRQLRGGGVDPTPEIGNAPGPTGALPPLPPTARQR